MSNGFGVKRFYSLEAVTNKTLFRLNTTVAEIFGKNDIFSNSLLSNLVTIEDLLAHRVGLPLHGRIRFDSILTRQNLVKRLKYLKPVGEFRNGFYYSDILYGLVTAIAERISRKSWEKLMTEEIFKPLSMTSSDLVTTVD
ncbi:hypothetical protein KUTeg_018308 [Tegillarca granosa]|uniref:Beta-lactamase-related domain-containing protein n=1 Tax=Tegillarca granosa TaxID=220873 RepID=A0ABQ9EMU8_TEGGR|nr:hypothetical protein KUTeg_018308 [Tegillarca granosa]